MPPCRRRASSRDSGPRALNDPIWTPGTAVRFCLEGTSRCTGVSVLCGLTLLVVGDHSASAVQRRHEMLGKSKLLRPEAIMTVAQVTGVVTTTPKNPAPSGCRSIPSPRDRAGVLRPTEARESPVATRPRAAGHPRLLKALLKEALHGDAAPQRTGSCPTGRRRPPATTVSIRSTLWRDVPERSRCERPAAPLSSPRR